MSELYSIFNRVRLDDRQIDELVGIAHGLTADGVILQSEAEYLQKWLTANIEVNHNPIIANLLVRINEMLSDGYLDPAESFELFETLQAFSGGEFEIGELLKSSTLPIDDPAPNMLFEGTRFCFTGTFAFGSRRECETAVTNLNATAGSLTKKTNYLVIGAYATNSWAHSSFGRKIENAVEMRNKGIPISIVSEEHWIKQARLT